jgi:hypothetical protein
VVNIIPELPLQYTYSDRPFGIVKLFLYAKKKPNNNPTTTVKQAKKFNSVVRKNAQEELSCLRPQKTVI